MRFITKVNFNKNIEEADQFCKFDIDPVPQPIEEHLKLSGWVIGIESPAVGIELIQDGQLVGEAPLRIHRPRANQIYAAFLGSQKSGFVIDLALEKINFESGQISIQAVFEDFKRIPLASLSLSQISVPNPRKKTFFVHVGKTAGSSFNKFLHTHLQGNSHCEAYLQSSQPWTFKNLDLLKSWDFISGHLNIQYFNKNFERDQYFLVTLLRNPFDQIISHVNWLAYIHQFDHNSAFYQNHPDVIKKIGYNLSERDLTNPLEVIDFLLENKRLLKNTQSNYFKTNSNNADAIIENLLNFDLVGLTEAYSKFIEKYVSLIGLGDMIEPIVNRENVNLKPALNKKELLRDSNFVDFINDYNAVDIEVYNYFYNLQKNGLDNLTSEPLSRSEKTLHLRKQEKLQTELDKAPENPEQLPIKFEQQSDLLKLLKVESGKMPQNLVKTSSELQETKGELQRSQSQFDEVLLELETTHSQLQQTQAELKQCLSQLQQTQTEFPKTQTNAIQPVSDRPKCQLSICAILKDEGLYIIEWLEFHKIVGVERFYLYDNGSTDDVFEQVKPYIDRGEIIWHNWPEKAGQRSSYNHCLKHYREESEWIAFIDLDEFLFPSEEDDLKKVLEEYKEYPAIGVNWLCFGSSGHITKPEGLVTENFTRRPTDDEASAQHGGRMKSIVRPTQTIEAGTVHHFIYVNKQQAVTENQQVFVGPRTPCTSVKKLRINHYLTKSREEFRIKSNRGAGNGSKKTFASFEKYDQNQMEDLTIQRFVPALKSAVESTSKKFNYDQSIELPDQFNPALYIASNAKLIESIGYDLEAGKKHYLEEGYLNNWPIDWFDPRSYLNKYKNLSKALGNNWESATRHYIVHGYKEQRFWTTDLSVIEAVLKREPDHKGAIQEKTLAVAKTRGTQIVDNNQPPNPIVDSIAEDQLQSIQTNYLKLDLGCGGKKKPGTIGLDYRAVPGVVDHVLNLQTDKFPFPDRSVDYVYSAHCLEHLTESPVHLFKEISRVCVEGSRLEFWTPYVWHNSAFIYGHTTYYQEDNYMHLCVWFPDFWSPGLGARWYLKELVYVIDPRILVELYKQKVQLDFAVRYYKGVVHELGAIIEVSHENKGQIIYPQRSFTTNRFAQRFLLQQQSQPLDKTELDQAINWFNGSSS